MAEKGTKKASGKKSPEMTGDISPDKTGEKAGDEGRANTKAAATPKPISLGKPGPTAPATVDDKTPATAMPEQTPETDAQGEKPARGPAHRPIWSGTISIGLVNVPIKLYSMTRDRSVSFRLLHKEDGQPLRYERVCVKDGKIVPWEDTVKGFEVRKNRFVVFDATDFKAVVPESDRRIRLDKFVHWLSLDPIYFESTYLLAPDRNPEAYGLLLGTLERQGKAGVGRITLRTKEYPAVVHVHGSQLVLTTLRYADEVLELTELEELTEVPRPSDTELEIAEKILDGLTGDFDIREYRDHYRDRVLELVQKKMAGEKIVVAAPPKEEVRELMTALRETLDQMNAS